MGRLLVWRGFEGSVAEAAEVELQEDRFGAIGTQLGHDPHAYRADYELTTTGGWVTERLRVEVRDEAGGRGLDLRRGDDGAWTANGQPIAGLDGALDCDLANCPLTNSMPLLRERLRERSEPADFLMSWVSLPDLSVRASRQRYEPVDGGTVRFVSLDSDFVAELELDEDGLVVRYPGMAERV